MTKEGATPQAEAIDIEAYAYPWKEVAQKLRANVDSGLSVEEIKKRQAQYGENELKGDEGVPIWKVFVKQCSNAMILVLILAMVLSYAVQDWIEGGVITAVIVLNVTIGFFQEFKAEKTMEALRNLSTPSARVLRDGVEAKVPSKEVVPGDIVILVTGDVIPADLRLYETMNFECEEMQLTGESEPVGKDPNAVFDKNTGVGDRINLAFATTKVTKGRCKGIVIATGMSTEIGKIALSVGGKKARPANRTMDPKKGGWKAPITGGGRRTLDWFGKFLGLTEGTPLQRKLAKLAYILLFCAILLAIIVFAVNKFDVTHEVTIYAISLGIAIIPESLIAVLTITMAVGMKRMVNRKVIVRKLDALEALGGVTNICSDKTGTLTQGRMITKKAWIPGVGIYSVEKTGDPFDPTSGAVRLGATPTAEPDAEKEYARKQQERDQARSALALTFDEPVGRKRVTEQPRIPEEELADGEIPDVTPALESIIHTAALCNIAKVRFDDEKRKWIGNGDPTEIALAVFSQRWGYERTGMVESGWKALSEYPFDSSIKRMSTVYRKQDGQDMIFAKGAVERILERCTRYGPDAAPITEENKTEILRQMSLLADQGFRVLALANRVYTTKLTEEEWKKVSRDDVEQEYTFLGLLGIYDPPRLETKDAIKACTQAGIQVHMLTGDHPSTARAIARDVGIIPRDFTSLAADVVASMVKTGVEFDAMTDEEIDNLPTLPFVIARCAPDTKTKMIKALRRRNRFSAMTGDGVNDAPSLSEADVGIAMGMNGSDVAKSASAIVLTDDNFASIVNAVEEGRRMFDNIQKFILHLLVSNVGEVILLIIGLAFQDSKGFSVFPLSPLEILWINMITSSFPAFGLGLENATSDIMRREPHDNKKGVFTTQILVDMIVYGFLMGTLTLSTFVIIVYGVGNGDLGNNCNAKHSASCDTVFRARGAVFAELTWLILISAWEFKSIRRSMFRLDPYQTEHKFPFFTDIYANKFLFWSVVIGALSVFPVVYIPGLNTNVFKHKGITWEWALAVGAVPVFVLGVELWKFVKRRFGLFNRGVSDRVKKDASVSLRQGFFTMAKTMTRTSTSGFSRPTTMEKRNTGLGLPLVGDDKV
ncbi:potassium/sodium efflux P-type ATPase [Peziza echinospora]|nr:potassium/sodium efflux P-type ATPase [Peziza echinospora]